MKTRMPDYVTVYTNNTTSSFGADDRIAFDDVKIFVKNRGSLLNISAAADKTPLRYVKLRWNFTENERRDEPIKILGDEWERGYGAMEWRGIVPERCMPWYFIASNGSDSDRNFSGRHTECFGVKVRPAALCFWQYDAKGVTLWMDIRCGGEGVVLSGRKIDLADVIFSDYHDISAFEAGRWFCREMCTDPIAAPHRVYGSNNWYYAYGNSSHEEILSDTEIVADFCRGLENIPYMVIDDGWQPSNCDGPWDRGNAKFPDMHGLAQQMTKLGVRPGIWIRFLSDEARATPNVPKEWRLSRDPKYLDPSNPGVIEKVKEDTRRIVSWGYQLIKHDYSTYDIFGKWGCQCPDKLTADGWSFWDKGRTSAEIVLDFYRAIYNAIREADGNAIIIGCNTISHLCAGLVELNRTGDDTSGKEWNKTRKCGVNTLAFRLMQNNAFYACDADCVGIMGTFPWELNRKWLYALSRSGSPLFVSCKPGVTDQSANNEIREAYAVNSVQKDDLIPVDWMENICPKKWLLNGEPIEFDWFDDNGTANFKP